MNKTELLEIFNNSKYGLIKNYKAVRRFLGHDISMHDFNMLLYAKAISDESFFIKLKELKAN